jgi:hypothetical protein
MAAKHVESSFRVCGHASGISETEATFLTPASWVGVKPSTTLDMIASDEITVVPFELSAHIRGWEIELVYDRRNLAGGTESKLTMLILNVVIAFIGKPVHITGKREELLTML